MKNIIVREAYDWIYMDPHHPEGLTAVEWESLLLFLNQKYQIEKVIEYSNKKVRFINLVGVVQLKTVRLEIIPKIDLNHEDLETNRHALLNMLSITKKLPIEIHEKTLSNYEKVDLLHVLAKLFIVKLYKELKQGVYREYHPITDNINHLKGRLVISQHIRKNAVLPIKAVCEYDELSPNILFNQVLKAALKVIYPYVQNTSLKIQTIRIFEIFKEVDDVYLRLSSLKDIQCNRQNQHYESILQLAIAILSSTSMSIGQNNQIAFSFLFKMNDLFECYIGELLKRILISSKYKVDLQDTEKRLLLNVNTGRENILLKPDFVVSAKQDQNFVQKIILDTKWKSVSINSRLLYQQSDIYQMYAYITAYESAERCIIIYPKKEEVVLPKWLVPHSSPAKYIEIQTVRLDKIQHTLEDLEELFLSIIKHY